MSNNQDEWENSPAARRREAFFEATPSGSSRLSDPPKDVDMPERPRRRQTPHPKAGTFGLVSQQSEVYSSSSRAPYQSVDQQRQLGDDYRGRRASMSYDQGTQDHRRGLSPTQPTTSRDLSKDGFDGTFKEQRQRKPSGGSGSGKKVTINKCADVRYLQRHSPGSSPESRPDSRQGEPSSGRADTGQREAQVGQLEYAQTRTRNTQAWKMSNAVERRNQGRRESHERDNRDKDTVRHREQQEAYYSDERSSYGSDRGSGERRRRSDVRSSRESRRSDGRRGSGEQKSSDPSLRSMAKGAARGTLNFLKSL